MNAKRMITAALLPGMQPDVQIDWIGENTDRWLTHQLQSVLATLPPPPHD